MESRKDYSWKGIFRIFRDLEPKFCTEWHSESDGRNMVIIFNDKSVSQLEANPKFGVSKVLDIHLLYSVNSICYKAFVRLCYAVNE